MGWKAQSSSSPSRFVLLLGLLLTSGPIHRTQQHNDVENNNDIDAADIIRSIFRSSTFGVQTLHVGTAHAFAPESHVVTPASIDAGSTSRHPRQLQMAKLGTMPEYSFDDAPSGNTQREIRQLRSDISKTDARLRKLRKESAKMDAAGSTAGTTAGSTSASSAIGTAFRVLLTPVAALGAGRSYLQQRNEVQEEIARTEAELQAKKEALERVEKFTGVSDLIACFFYMLHFYGRLLDAFLYITLTIFGLNSTDACICEQFHMFYCVAANSCRWDGSTGCCSDRNPCRIGSTQEWSYSHHLTLFTWRQGDGLVKVDKYRNFSRAGGQDHCNETKGAAGNSSPGGSGAGKNCCRREKEGGG